MSLSPKRHAQSELLTNELGKESEAVSNLNPSF